MPFFADDDDKNKLSEVQAKYIDELMNKANVVGVAIGYVQIGGVTTDEQGVIVMVTEKKPEAELTAKDLVPRELDGVRVDVQAFGVFTA
jgi:hypothetical protein